MGGLSSTRPPSRSSKIAGWLRTSISWPSRRRKSRCCLGRLVSRLKTKKAGRWWKWAAWLSASSNRRPAPTIRQRTCNACTTLTDSTIALSTRMRPQHKWTTGTQTKRLMEAALITLPNTAITASRAATMSRPMVKSSQLRMSTKTSFQSA